VKGERWEKVLKRCSNNYYLFGDERFYPSPLPSCKFQLLSVSAKQIKVYKTRNYEVRCVCPLDTITIIILWCSLVAKKGKNKRVIWVPYEVNPCSIISLFCNVFFWGGWDEGIGCKKDARIMPSLATICIGFFLVEVGLRAQNAIWNFKVPCDIISNTFKVKI
jgi:hypothetical protein